MTMSDSYAIVMLGFYFMFLFGILYMARNVEQVARNRVLEAVVDKVRYNLRDVPRINYAEVDTSSEEDATPEASEEESEVESEEEVVRKRRRDPNPMARMIEEVD